MKNAVVKVSSDKKKLTIEVDLSKELGPSKSGKTIIIATSEGNQKVEGTDVVLGLNLYKKKTEG